MSTLHNAEGDWTSLEHGAQAEALGGEQLLHFPNQVFEMDGF
jgi:hypothetical protein